MKRLLFALIAIAIGALSSPVLAQEQILSVLGTAPVMEKVAVGNTSALLATLFDAAYSGTDPTWTKVRAVLITCEDYDVRIAFGRAAALGASPMGHLLTVGSSLYLPSGDLVRKLYVINKTNAEVGNLMVTVLH